MDTGAADTGAPPQPSGCVLFVLWPFVWAPPILLVAVITALIRLGHYPWYLAFKVASFVLVAVLLALAGYWGMSAILKGVRRSRAWVIPTAANAMVVVSGALESDHKLSTAVLGLVLSASVSVGMWQAYRRVSDRPLTLGHKLALAGVTILSLVLIALPATHGVRDFSVSGDAMRPTLLQGDIVWFSTTSRARAAVQVDDIVLVQDPQHPDRILIRRLAGVPGETPVGYTSGNLRDDEFWVTSDNPGDGYDSTQFGSVATDQMLGAAVCRISGDRWEWF